MSINLFEGGRRINRLLQILIAVGCAASVFIGQPNASVDLETSSPSDGWHISGSACDYEKDAIEFGASVDIGESETASADLCFRSSKSDSGDELVPYESIGNNRVVLGERYSNVVSDYTKQRAEKVTLSPSEQESARKLANSAWWKSLRENAKIALVVALVGCVGLWLIGLTVGWIVRGFASIPAGQDRRTDL